MIIVSGGPHSAATRPFRLHLKFFSGLALLAMLLAAGLARAGEPDEDFLPIYTRIQDAESLEANGQNGQALAKYKEALGALKEFQKRHPDWNAKVVNTRLNRLGEKVTVLSLAPAIAVPARTNSATAGNQADGSSGKGASEAAPGTIKVLDAGAEPRKVLRLHPKVGDKQSLDMTLKIAMESKMGQMDTPAQKLPAIKLSLDVTVKSISPEGDISYETVLSDVSVADDPGVIPQVAAVIKAMYGKAKGTSATGTISDRGESKSVDIKFSGGNDPQSRQAMDQMKQIFSGAMLKLPEEAVGSGAKWEVRKTDKAQGFPVESTDTCQIVSLEGDLLKAKTTVSERAANQKIQVPKGSTVKMEIIKMVGTGSGALTYDLGQLMPSEATADQHVDTTTAMGAPQKQMISQKMDLKISLQAR